MAKWLWVLPAFIVIEILSIIAMTSWLGGVAVLVLMVGKFALGLWLIRRFGIAGTLLMGQTLTRSNGLPSFYELLWPARYGLSALLLMSPGFVSTLLSVALMLPLKHPLAATEKPSAARPRAASGRAYTGKDTTNPTLDIIEGDYRVTRVTRVTPVQREDFKN